MAKAYWVVAYRKIHDPEKLASYGRLAGPATAAAGGRALARGIAAEAHEIGQADRTVVLEFDSLEQARAAYHTPAYQEALAALGDGAERDFRIVEGL